MLLILVFFREKPKTPPSASSGTDDKNNDVMGNIKILWNNKNFRKLLFTFGIMFGTANTYGTLVGVIADKKGYSDSDASVFGGTFIFGGIIGSGALGTFVEST